MKSDSKFTYAEVSFEDNLLSKYDFDLSETLVDYSSINQGPSFQRISVQRSNEYDDWVEFWRGVEVQDGDEVFHRLDELIHEAPKSAEKGGGVLLDKLRHAINDYLFERQEGSDFLSKLSSQSLLNLFLYLPQLPCDSDVYIEQDSGFFGVSLNKGADKLAITVKDNREIIYSFVSIDLGLTKFSGRGYISDVRESIKLKKIIRILKDG